LALHLHFLLKISVDLFGSLVVILSAQQAFQNVQEFGHWTDWEVTGKGNKMGEWKSQMGELRTCFHQLCVQRAATVIGSEEYAWEWLHPPPLLKFNGL
jgi:hypothetical protein